MRKVRNCEGCGVRIGISNNISYNRWDDLSSPDLESLSIDMLVPMIKH